MVASEARKDIDIGSVHTHQNYVVTKFHRFFFSFIFCLSTYRRQKKTNNKKGKQKLDSMSQSGIYPSTNNNSSTSNANSMPIAAENYQLKWNSHVTNLNSSICSLYKNDKYADCMLFTCNSDEGSFGFPAHKVILGTCSHYFASLFDNNPMPTSGMIFIVLPPELNRRAMGILLQYMYMGEATVSNDILNEVLKGGEVLKIRGLCKVQSDTPTFVNSSKYETTTQAIPVAASSSNFNQIHYNSNQSTAARASPMRSNKSTPRSSIDRKSSSDMKNHINGSNSFDSPVSNPPAVVNLSNNQPSTTIIVKKDVAIDPGDNNIPVEHYGLISLKIAAAVKKAQQQNSHNISSMKKSSNVATSSIVPDPHHQNREFYSTIIADRESSSQQHFDSPPPPPFKVYTSSNEAVCNLQQQIQEDILRYTEKKKRIAENPNSVKCESRYIENGSQSQFHHSSDERERISSSSHSQHFPEALSFLTIKEEPLEWSEMDVARIDNKGELVAIKPESIDEAVHAAPQDKSSTSFSPLTCELCNLKFQVPAAWVRHIESHSEVNNTNSSSSCSSGSLNSAQNLPKKRKRTTDEVSRI